MLKNNGSANPELVSSEGGPLMGQCDSWTRDDDWFWLTGPVKGFQRDCSGDRGNVKEETESQPRSPARARSDLRSGLGVHLLRSADEGGHVTRRWETGGTAFGHGSQWKASLLSVEVLECGNAGRG